MCSEGRGDLRRRYTGEICHGELLGNSWNEQCWFKELWLPRWEGRRALLRIGCRENFQTSGFLSQGLRNGDTVFHVCLPPLLAALCWQITAHHIRSFCLSCPAQKNDFTPRDYHKQQQFGCLRWAGSPGDLSTDHPPQTDRLGSLNSAFSLLVIKCVS